MRLLHSKTLQLGEFADNVVPPYAILSHTWGKDEVSFREIKTGRGSSKEGFNKIRQCCLQAQLGGFEYVWIDTCCIDKSSSAELTEAINSMYRWYKNAQICYAYLADVPSDPGADAGFLFAKSRWFTRGWTLQELIAPENVVFYGSDWAEIGTKADLCTQISEITGIDEAILKGGNLGSVSLAKRMSWASKRVTTRTEDIAYCLIGIFGVNMPMLYGEGEKAFIRLQEEIMKDSDDQSLFAWGSDHNVDYSNTGRPRLRGMLARSPAEFSNARDILPFRRWYSSEPYSMTNKGLRVQLPLVFYDQTWVGILDCQFKDDFERHIGVKLHPLADRGDMWASGNLNAEGDQFARLGAMPCILPLSIFPKTIGRRIYVRKEVLYPDEDELNRKHGFLIRFEWAPTHGFSLSQVYPAEMWNANQRIVRVKRPNAGEEWCAGLLFSRGISREVGQPESFVVLLGCDKHLRGIYSIRHSDGSLTLEEIFRRACTEPWGSWGTFLNSDTKHTYLNDETRILVDLKKEMVMSQTMFVVDIDIHIGRPIP